MRIKKITGTAIIPKRAHHDDAGLDLAAKETVTVSVGARVTIGTGIAVALPEGTVGLVYPRSGLASRHGLTLVNAVGVVDSGYRGEIMLAIINHGHRPFTIEAGMRVAQMIITPYLAPEIEIVDQLDDTARGTGGLGSTGTK